MAEISYDLVMRDDMDFVEGTFRLYGGEWQILIVSKQEVPEAEMTRQVWESGVTGVTIHFPGNRTLNHQAGEELLSAFFTVERWRAVQGPDSMALR